MKVFCLIMIIIVSSLLIVIKEYPLVFADSNNGYQKQSQITKSLLEMVLHINISNNYYYKYIKLNILKKVEIDSDAVRVSAMHAASKGQWVILDTLLKGNY